MNHINLEDRLKIANKNLFVREYEKAILNKFINEEMLEDIRYARELQNVLGDEFLSDETKEIANYSDYLQDFLDVSPTEETKLRVAAFLISIKTSFNQDVSDEIAYAKNIIKTVPSSARSKGQRALIEALIQKKLISLI